MLPNGLLQSTPLRSAATCGLTPMAAVVPGGLRRVLSGRFRV